MPLYKIGPDHANWGVSYKYEFNATHKWSLPGLKCSGCGATWSTTGLAYPTVQLSQVPNEKRYRDPSPVSLSEFERLLDPIRALVPSNFVLRPGTGFGPLVGKARGTFGSFAWNNPWTMLVQSSVLSALNTEDVVGLVPSPTQLTMTSKRVTDLSELEILPAGELAPDAFGDDESAVCPICGRDPRRILKLVVVKSSIPDGTDLFRVRSHPTQILVTERFVNVARKLNLTDIIFSAIQVTD